MLKKSQTCIGKQPVLEALESGQHIEKIFLRKGFSGKVFDMVISAARKAYVPISWVPKEKLNRMSNLNHQGVIAILSPVQYYKVEDIVDQCYAEGRNPLILVLDGVTDVGNFGAICRTALGMGVDAVVIGYNRAASVNEHALKASAGAIHHLKICRHRSIKEVVNYLKQAGVSIIAMAASGKIMAKELDSNVPNAIILGAEGDGIGKELLILADSVCKLPMNPKLESYNVSVAAALILYELKR